MLLKLESCWVKQCEAQRCARARQMCKKNAGSAREKNMLKANLKSEL